MSIRVHLHTIYQKKTDNGLINKYELPYLQNQTMEMVIHLLDLDIPEDSSLLVVNGKIAELDYIIQDGDHIHLIPAISGGLY